jgi:putative salt-induced outer membrane protein YdiY
MALSAINTSTATTLVVLAFTLQLCSARNTQAAQSPSEPDQSAEIREREEAIAGAVHTRDRKRLEQLLAPEFILRGTPDLDREGWLHNAVTLCWGDRSRIDQLHVRQVGDVVIAGFELTFYSDPVTCRPAVLRSLITDVWARDEGEWRLRLRHTAPAPADTAGTMMQYAQLEEPPPTLEANSELSLVATGGNTSTRTIGAGGNLTYRTEARRTRLAVAFLTSDADEETLARSLTAQARHGISLGKRVNLFGEALYARDVFAGIEDRRTLSTGATITTPMPRGQTLNVESSVGYTAERRLDEDLWFATGSAALAYTWTMRPGTTLTEDLAFIADFEEASNWRSASVTTVTVTLTRLLSLKATQAVDYRRTPVPGFRRTDLRTAVALVVSLQRRPPTP